MRILIVDDEIVIRKGIKKLLEELHNGITAIEEAKNGEEALLIMTSFKPDIIITDIQMPVMNGLDLCAAVRERYPDAELIILTGFAEFEYVQQALRYQVTDYLLKPVTKDNLQKVLMQIVLKDPSRWTMSLDADSIRVLKNTVAALVKGVVAENKADIGRIMSDWRDYCTGRAFSLLDLKRVMGHFYIMFRSELMMNLKNPGPDEIYSLNNNASSADELFAAWKRYIEEQLAFVAQAHVPRNKRVVDEAVAMIEESYGNPGLNLNLLAVHCGVNPPYLSKMFREIMKKPITQFISEYRLERARDRLKNEESEKITIISEQCGFNDYPYFSKIFKRVYGISPLEYREKN